MTKEEAIKGLKENLCSLCAYGSQNMDSCDIKGCDNRDYINALEQEAYYKNLAQSYEKTINKLTKAIAEQQPSDDCVSRQAVKDIIHEYKNNIDSQLSWLSDGVCNLPPVTPTHGTCEDCKWWDSENNEIGYCNACKHGHCSSTWNIGIYRKTKADFYCADFEK